MTLATYGKGGAGATISWATTDSPVGRILVAATPRGLCFVEVGTTPEKLVAGLRREFPLASIDEAKALMTGSNLKKVLSIIGAHPS
jgi:AraC family transcriptional regulator of adaptative response/methylated-DNA-[protein]-cysteine methyltransferase